MSEDFSGGSRIAWTVLDPRTGTSHIIDPQYERERRTAKATPSRRTPCPAAESASSITRTLASVGFDAPFASKVAREFVDIP